MGTVGGKPLTGFPQTADEFKAFDVLIIGDLDRSYLSSKQMDLLVEVVRSGKGLLMIGGTATLGPGGYGGTVIEQMLPVTVGPRGRDRQEATPFVPRLTAEVNVDRTGWSSYDRLAINFDNGAPGIDRSKDWEDVWAYRLGVQYGLSDHLDVRLGYAYDESPVPDATLGPELPDADRNNYSAGIGYKDTWGSIDLAYMFVDFDDRTVSNDIQTGTYKSEAHLFGSSVTVKF